jgi:hypothetical protein
MNISEGLTRKVASSLVNCYSQDIWQIISDHTAVFVEGFDQFNDFTMEYLNDKDLLREAL